MNRPSHKRMSLVFDRLIQPFVKEKRARSRVYLTLVLASFFTLSRLQRYLSLENLLKQIQVIEQRQTSH